MRITLTANTDWYLHNFRLDLARALAREGHEVNMVCPPGPYVELLQKEGFQVLTFTAPRRGFSLPENRRALKEIRLAFQQLRPELVHLFTPLCVLLGSIAQRELRIPYKVAALTGLGHVFTSHSIKARLVRPFMGRIFARELARDGTAVIFQNESDQADMIRAGLVEPERCHLIRGSGVDVKRFVPAWETTETDRDINRPGPSDEVRILFASRLLREKGIDELLAAFRDVHERLPRAQLWIAGEVYSPNPTSLTDWEVESLYHQPGVKVLGQVQDMPALLKQVDLVALPSYREGTPKILLEAAAQGLPIVASDISGCRGVVEEGVSGYLVPVKDTKTLTKRLFELCNDDQKRRAFGEQGREIILKAFTSEIVIRKTLDVYRLLIKSS